MRSAIDRNTARPRRRDRRRRSGGRRRRPRAARARAGSGRATAPRAGRRAPAPPPSPNRWYSVSWSPRNHDMFSITPITCRLTFAAMPPARSRDLLRRGLRRGDDDHLGARQELRHRQRDVAGAGRHVDDEVVGLAPVHVGEELLERLVQHRAAPHDGLVLAGEEAHRDERTPLASGGTITSSMTVGGRSMPSMRGIEKPHTSASTAATAWPRLRERDREVGGDRRLADATLARCDREHAGLGVDERVGAAGRWRGLRPSTTARVGGRRRR